MELTKRIVVNSGGFYGHVQGIVFDREKQNFYLSFTTKLVKTDMQGNILASVTGLAGHLGCIAWNEKERRIYGSLEYKHDSIGQGILSIVGDREYADSFYIARFDADKITEPDMDAEKSGVMTAVYLREVCEDYAVNRYGCGGMDGVTFAPAFGSDDGKLYLYAAYGIYGDTGREDNDHQVLLQYDVENWDSMAKPLHQEDMHRCGPEKPDRKLFVFTGNTTFGIQNLEYDAETELLLAAVYTGEKPQYPNWPMFFIDRSESPVRKVPQGLTEEQDMIFLADAGRRKTEGGIPGSDFPHGSTGMVSLGEGLFYISRCRRDDRGEISDIGLYRFSKETGEFTEV